MADPTEAAPARRTIINTNTGLSLALVVLIIGSVMRVEGGFSSLKESQAIAQAEAIKPLIEAQSAMGTKLSLIEYRLAAIENNGMGMVPYPVFRAFARDLERMNIGKDGHPGVVVPTVP